jgi:ankyrin
MNRIDSEMICAVFGNNVPEVSRLLRSGADVNAKDTTSDSKTPLHRACYYGHVRIVKELMDHGADIDAEEINGRTPLHSACRRGHLPIVIELLTVGAGIDAQDNHGHTPLHDASMGGHLLVIKALVSGGADILAANNEGRLPIHHAVFIQKSEVAKYLLQHFYATRTRRLPLHELLRDLTWIRDPNSRVGVPVPPLRDALYYDLLRTNDVVEILEYLVDQNPGSIASRDQDGSLPLHVACRRGASFNIVRSLVNRYGASVKSVTPQGNLPLFLACEMSEPSLDAIFLLIKHNPTCDVVYD